MNVSDLPASRAACNVPDHVLDAMAREYRDGWARLASIYPRLYRSESPIEAALLAALIHRSHAGLFAVCVDPGPIPADALFAIVPQQSVGRFRADFLVTTRRGQIVVECDGHDWHERSRWQAMRDKLRDRILASQGIFTLRFTGSEIWADAIDCAAQVETMACRMAWGQLDGAQG
jgi:hypothetical protein